MFKKLNSKTLIVVFGVLLVLVVVLKLVQHSKGDRNFNAKFFEVDTAKVTAFVIKPRVPGDEVRLVRNGNNWDLVKKNKTYRVEKNLVQPLLYELVNLKPDHLAAMDKSEWAQYQVTDTAATRVKVEQDGKVVADFFLGKFSFQQYQQTSYVRINNDDNVYAVNGIPAMSFNKSADDFRNKVLVQINQVSDITKLDFIYPDSSFVLQKDSISWTVNGERLDSAKVATYLSSISSLYGSEFVDDAVTPGPLKFSLRIEGKNFQPVELKAYEADADNQYAITSNMNADGKFSGSKGDLTKRVFVGKSSFKAAPKSKKK